MASHDAYGKRVLMQAAGSGFASSGKSIQVDFGIGASGKIDGTVGGTIAVEIESGAGKRSRGAVLDLLWHPYPKKLLIVIPVQATNPETGAWQLERVLARFMDPVDFRVVVLQESGSSPRYKQDVGILVGALSELGFVLAPKSAQIDPLGG